LVDLFSLFFFQLSGSILDVYSDEQGISSANAGLTDAPCPSILPMRKEIAGNVEFLKV
jgi:transcription factor EC